MILRDPFKISSRLLPALEVAGAWLQLEYSEQPGRDGRTRYRWTIDLPDGTSFTGDDLQSGCGGGGLQEGFVSLLGFLSACGESVAYARRMRSSGENENLFPAPVGQWAEESSDELATLEMEMEDAENLIEEAC